MECPRCKSENADTSHMERGDQHNCPDCGYAWFENKRKSPPPVEAEPELDEETDGN